MSDNKNKRTTFRWQNIDFVYAQRQADQMKITLSAYLRRLVKNDRNKAEDENCS